MPRQTIAEEQRRITLREYQQAQRKREDKDKKRLRKARAALAKMRQEDSSSSEDESSSGLVVITPVEPATDLPETKEKEDTDANGTSDVKKDDKPDGEQEDTKEKEPEKLDPKEIGMSIGLKHLYSGKEDRKGRFQWQATIPDDVGKPVEDAETQKWALIVRHIKVYNDPSKVLAIHSIVVQSPLLKDLLSGVLKSYPGVTVGLQRLEFSGKFEPLLHRWPQFTAAVQELKDKVAGEQQQASTHGEAVASASAPESEPKLQDGLKTEIVDKKGRVIDTVTNVESGEDQAGSEPSKASASESETVTKLKHAELLQDVLVGEFQTVIDSSGDMKEKGVITYEHLWTIFQPGSLIYTKVEGQERVFRLRSGRYGTDRDGNPGFWLILLYVDFDGSRFGHQQYNIFVRAFSGTKSITSLTSYPLDSHKDKVELRQRLIDRGAKIEALAGTYYRTYDGIGWRENQWGAKEKFTVKGRIILDTKGWNQTETAVYVVPFNRDSTDPAADIGGNDGSDNDGELDDLDMEDGVPIDGQFADEEDDAKRVPLEDEQKLMCTHLVHGYALREKMWLNLNVTSVSDVVFNERAFDSLVLPELQKELILGFTSSQQSFRNHYDDVIEGKGRGIILLLSGPPGVGKTLTAESVAEEMRVPLFVMSAGDIGFESRHTESKLLEVFEMVTRWNAILLIDEADVFLEERSLHEVERNKLVSIFLRVLEYYQGIMFLTTNRVQTFDAAFQSRIHISLDYPELSIESRKQVWVNFLKRHDFVQQTLRDQGPPKPASSAAKVTKAQAQTSEAPKQAAVVTQQATPPPDGHAGTEADSQMLKDATSPSAETLAHDLTEPAVDPQLLADHEAATQPHVLTDREVDSLARMHMNGRQIKNVLKTAQLLASRKREGLSKKHITTVLEVTQHLHNSTRETERARGAIYH